MLLTYLLTFHLCDKAEILGVVPLNSSSFIPPLLTIEFINQLNTSLILLVITLFSSSELFPLPNKKQSLCRIFQETPQNPPLQF